MWAHPVVLGGGADSLLSGPVSVSAVVANLAATGTQRPGDAEHAVDVALNRDTDGDGAADLLIASPQSSASGSANEGPGEVTVLLGSDIVADGVDGLPPRHSRHLHGEARISVDWVDPDGDCGFDDAVVGAHLSEPNDLNNAGAVYVIAGLTTTSVT